MNKTDFIRQVAEKSGQSNNAAGSVVDAAIKTIIETVKSGDKITIPGFATFDRSERKARTAKNPRTGETVQVPARKVMRVKVSKNLQNEISN